MAKVEWLPAPCTTKQLSYTNFLRSQAGMSVGELYTVVSRVVGTEPDGVVALTNMTQSEASRVIDCLKVLVKLKGGRLTSDGYGVKACTKEQREYIKRLRIDRGMSYHELVEHFDVTDIGQLTKADASEAIEWLKR